MAGIHYDEYRGGGSVQGRPPLVLIHGSGGSRLHWPPAVRRMQGQHVYALDLPGHGDSAPPCESSVAGYAQRLMDWLGALDLERVILAGHSLGGAIALHAAAAFPQRVAGLVLVGTGARLRVHPAILETTADPGGFDQAVAQVMEWAFSTKAPARLVELAHKRMLETDPRVLHKDFQACDAFDMMDQLGEIRAPALALCGSEDRLTPPKYSRYLAENIPDAGMSLVEGAGHMVMLERPDRVASAIAAFIDEHFPAQAV
jgi:pimeloyl-ACP methyl ester carboxylesterase